MLRAERSGIRIGQLVAAGGALTDTSRNKIVSEHLKGDADYLIQFDDDTVPPPGTIARLVEMQVPIASGVYFGRVDVKKGERPMPLIYRHGEGQTDRGQYYSVTDYVKGEILTVDGIGMGCSCIHRSVFESIQDHYVLMRRHTGPIMPVWPDDVAAYEGVGMSVYDPLSAVAEINYPFFAFDNGRTEDLFFCELAARLGIRPVVDTRIECKHLGEYAIDGEDFWSGVLPMQLRGSPTPGLAEALCA